jgi:hypothetical protein
MKQALTIFALLLLAACNKETAAPAAPPASTSTQAASAPGAASDAREGLIYALPSGWERVQPSSSMRLDQARIPGSAGPGELAVFFFGTGGGGGAEANLQRWIEQVEGGTPARETFDANGLKVSIVDVSGTLQPSSMGSGPQSPQPNSRLIGAVVEGNGGPWFFKATGPADTLAAQREAFLTMLRNARSAQ